MRRRRPGPRSPGGASASAVAGSAPALAWCLLRSICGCHAGTVDCFRRQLLHVMLERGELASLHQDIPAQGADMVSSRPWCRMRRPGGDVDLRGHQYLAVPFGVGETVERRADVLQADVAGDHRGDIDVAFGYRPQ